MTRYDAFRDRVKASGTSMQDATLKGTKRQAFNNIMNSPTLSYVRLNDDIDLTPVIASDKETFHKRVFLFVPDSVINVGDYVHQTDNATYLAVDKDIDDFGTYPQLIGELCNDVFILKTDATKVIVGYNDFNRPIFREIGAQTHHVPCVLTTKIYSTVENSAVPLPDGSMIIRMTYNPLQIPKINYVFTHRENPYKVTTISYENVINEIGYIEIRLQRTTGSDK